MVNLDGVRPVKSPQDSFSKSTSNSCVLLFLGSERSGTTFVQETLNKFYPVSQGNESDWVISAWRKAQNLNIATTEDQLRFMKLIFSDWYFANKANYHQVYFDYRQFVQSETFDYTKFVEAVFRHIADAEQNQWVLNKTCLFSEHMPIVDEIFDRPKVINLVRDGRDVGLSLIKTKAWGPVSPYGAARWWSKRVDKIQQYAEENMQGRYLELKYEDLTRDPGAHFEHIAKFYGIFEEERHANLLKSVRIISKNSEKWRSQFSESEVHVFERVAGDSLKRNGYQLVNEVHKPLSNWEYAVRRLNESIFSRISFYPLWFRSLRIINRLIGLSPKLQQKFHRSAFFANHFNWNKNMGVRNED